MEVHSTPIGSTPNEVLLEIFAYCLEGQSSAFLPNEAPRLMTLVQVCRRWRDVAYGLPGFWNKLSIQRYDLGPAPLEMLQTWLLRSKTKPIDFHIVATCPAQSTLRDLEALLERASAPHESILREILERQRERLKEQVAELPSRPPPRFLVRLLKPVATGITRLALNDVPLEALTALPRRAFPNLERLVLGVSTYSDWIKFDWTAHGPIKAFAHSPSPLTHVALRRFLRSDQQDHIHIPYSQLTHFVDYGSVYERTTDFFQRVLPVNFSANLHHLSVCIDVPDHNMDAAWADFPGPVVLPNIRVLNVTLVYDTDYPNFLDHLSFPDLRVFRVVSERLDHAVRLFTPGRFEALEHLTVGITSATNLHLPMLAFALHSVPQITSLEVPLTIEVLALLVLTRELPLVQRLVSLSLLNVTANAGSYATGIAGWEPYFTMLVKSRCERLEPNPTEDDDTGFPMRLRTVKILWNKWKSCHDGFDEKYAKTTWLVAKECASECDVTVERELVRKPLDPGLSVLLRDEEMKGWNGLEDLGDYRTAVPALPSGMTTLA